jgi:hypothetical protein
MQDPKTLSQQYLNSLSYCRKIVELLTTWYNGKAQLTPAADPQAAYIGDVPCER